MRSGIAHHKSDRKLCVIPTADRNTSFMSKADLESKRYNIPGVHRKHTLLVLVRRGCTIPGVLHIRILISKY